MFNLQNLLSLLRAIGAFAGAYLVGHAVFGHTISADSLQVIGGAILTIASTWWGIAAKTTNIEGIESAVRSVLSSIGGLGVSAGIISAEQLTAILSAIIPVVAFIQSALSKAKNKQIASGQVQAISNGKTIPNSPAPKS